MSAGAVWRLDSLVFCGELDFTGVQDAQSVARKQQARDAFASSGLRPSCGSPRFPDLEISADVHLHNRGDLIGHLGNNFSSKNPDDSELLLAAYAKWGERCAEFLLGEYAFAIWDERRRRLFCCRDHIGFRAFLYWRSPTRIIFSNSIERILSFPGVPRELNRRKLASLAVPTAHHLRHEETFHEGIFSLPPGCWMIVEQSGVRQGKYWELQPDAVASPPKRPDDVYEALRELLFEAVECRLDQDTPVASLLSGGLDSSAIVATAARCLERKNRQLTAVAAVLPEESKPQFSDEREFIDEFRAQPNVCIKYVNGRGRGPFDKLHDPDSFAVFPFRSSRSYLVEECEKAAIGSGAQSLLWGSDGELAVSSWGERYYVELALRLRWLKLFRELKVRHSYRNVNPFRRLAGEILDCVYPLRKRRPLVLLAPGLSREHPSKPVWKSRTPSQRGFQLAQIRLWLSKHAMERGQPVTLLRSSMPWVDKRILEFCLSVPPAMNIRDGYPRSLIRGALDGILPPRIQWRTTKAPFSPDYNIRYNAQLGMAREFVDAIGPRDPVRSVIDIERLRALVVPVEPSRDIAAARENVPLTLYMICFLRQFSEFRP